MTDRELLINAAKAAGVEIYCVLGNTIMKMTGIGNTLAPWDPLTDDGDALRLAVKLDLAVTPYPIYEKPKHSVLAQLKNTDDSRFEVMELHGTDPFAATRRAIVRAAAEIGKALK